MELLIPGGGQSPLTLATGEPQPVPAPAPPRTGHRCVAAPSPRTILRLPGVTSHKSTYLLCRRALQTHAGRSEHLSPGLEVLFNTVSRPEQSPETLLQVVTMEDRGGGKGLREQTGLENLELCHHPDLALGCTRPCRAWDKPTRGAQHCLHPRTSGLPARTALNLVTMTGMWPGTAMWAGCAREMLPRVGWARKGGQPSASTTADANPKESENPTLELALQTGR